MLATPMVKKPGSWGVQNYYTSVCHLNILNNVSMGT